MLEEKSVCFCHHHKENHKLKNFECNIDNCGCNEFTATYYLGKMPTDEEWDEFPIFVEDSN